ncbi:acid-sensing ion channel 1C isoform X1 [Hydra vulgaris]|uniref:Acid-sensing ion channel 1C isoform X1 n=1 Tax=Hydra vulgaris TaxID=6087 RepID=A0ABM4CXB9_HYDVU
MIYQDEIVFPAVTLCNFNFFPHYLINGTIGEKVISILAPLESFNQTHQELVSQQGPYIANIRDYRSVLPKNKWKRKKIANKDEKSKQEEIYFDRNFDFSEFVKKHGHKIGHMIKKCHWKAQKCGPENFTSVLTDFGLCYTFNPGTPEYPLLKVHRAGVDFGLRLQLNVQQDQYYGILRDSSGFKVMIHDQNEPPLINELGFAIHPGMHTFCSIRKTKVLNLPLPWETACEDKKPDGSKKYTKSACLMKCRAEFIISICKCRSFQHAGQAPVCLPHEIRDCVRPAIATFMNESDHCECPVPCEKIRYQTQLSYAQMPAKHYSEALAKLKHIDEERMRHFLRDNLLELDLYFEEMTTQVIQQVPAYDEESLFGDIGGQVGLFLGASMLTILEIVDLLGRVLIIKFGSRRIKDHLV